MTGQDNNNNLNTPMDEPEFLCININTFRDDVIQHYKLNEKVDVKGNM